MTINPDDLIGTADAAKYSNLNPETLRRAVRNRTIRYFTRKGKKGYYFLKEDLDAFAEAMGRSPESDIVEHPALRKPGDKKDE